MHRPIIAAGALVICITATGTPTMADKAQARLLPSVLTIRVKNFTFHPRQVKIRSGDRITFVNDDEEAHTVTSDDKSFDSEGIDGGGIWQHRFVKSGTYNYFCELHPYMKATIVVLPAASGAQ